MGYSYDGNRGFGFNARCEDDRHRSRSHYNGHDAGFGFNKRAYRRDEVAKEDSRRYHGAANFSAKFKMGGS